MPTRVRLWGPEVARRVNAERAAPFSPWIRSFRLLALRIVAGSDVQSGEHLRAGKAHAIACSPNRESHVAHAKIRAGEPATADPYVVLGGIDGGFLVECAPTMIKMFEQIETGICRAVAAQVQLGRLGAGFQALDPLLDAHG